MQLKAIFPMLFHLLGQQAYGNFLGSTGSIYGLEVNSQVDEHYHLEKAIRTASNYLKDAYSKSTVGPCPQQVTTWVLLGLKAK